MLLTLLAAATLATPECAASLSDDGRRMFDAVAPTVRTGTDIEKAMRSRLKHLVMKGDLDRYAARANGVAVAACLAAMRAAEAPANREGNPD